ncbi:MAG TPA: MFS transporter [Dehalococcoidia bacterium]|nr:MFS transporter [Dehalococcoidia bacterium]
MATTDTGATPPRHDPFAAARQPNFRYYLVGRLFSATATTLQSAAIAWQVYRISNSALALGVLGLVRFLPALLAGLLGGAVADSFDRRRVTLLAQLPPLACSLLLAATSSGDHGGLALIFALTFLIALASAFENPARQALLPQLVSRETFANAVAVATTVQQFAFVLGPALGGLLIATTGLPGAYTVAAALYAATALSLIPLRPAQVATPKRAISLAAMREGVEFVWHRQVLLGAMTLDLFAVIFGGATALLPVYAESVLKVGADGYGLLTAALPVGAALMSVLLVALPPVQRAGRGLLIAVAGFGLTTMLFGVSRSFPLSLVAYALTGAADQVSVIMRQTTIQLATPDALRGRVSAVSSIFIGASNQVGAIESGFVAAVTSATFSVVSGGAGVLAVVAAVAAGMPELRRYRLGDGEERSGIG